MLLLPDDWLWDSWIVDSGDEFHLFFLKAPRSLVDPGLRHEAATIGRATSTDLTNWTYHGDAMLPAASGWDDLALWTGSVARGDDGVWRLYYTALSSAGHGKSDQRIGLAESDDLRTWRRVGDAPVLEADPRYYKTLAGHGPASETWRDPFVFADPDGDGWHMLVTARDKDAPRLSDGVVAHARSHDMRSWDLGPPIAGPAGFGEVEVVQVRVIDGAAAARVHLPSTGTERTTAGGRRVQHVDRARRLGHRTVGPGAGSSVRRRTQALRRAARAAARRDLGLCRLPQPGARGEPVLRPPRPDPGDVVRRRFGRAERRWVVRTSPCD